MPPVEPSVIPSLEPTVNVEVALLPLAGTEKIWLALKATFAVMAETSNVAPDAVVIVPEFEIVPEPDNAKVPEEIVVVPTYVLSPERVKVPEPVFTIDRLSSVFLITPEKVVEVLSPPQVKIGLPEAPSRIPFDAIEPTVSEYPPKSKVPFIVMAEELGITPDAPSFNVPFIVV